MSVAAVIIALLFLIMMVIGVPVFAAMGICAFAGLAIILGPEQALTSFGTFVWEEASIFQLAAIPLFILTGTLVEASGMGANLFAAVKAWAGRIPNSLLVAVIVASTIFSAISGSSVANAAMLSLVAIPLLRQAGYPSHMNGGAIAAGGTLGILLPPSIPLIIYGILTDTSIGQLFLAGVVPGFVMAILFALYVMILARPRIQEDSRSEDITSKIRVTLQASGILLLPIFILVGIFSGIFTPTEVGAFSALYVLVLGIIQRRLTLRAVIRAARSATLTATMLLMLVVFGIVFTNYLSLEQVPQTLAAFVAGISPEPVIVFTAMVIAYLVMGMFLESGAMMILSIPIFFPVAMGIGLDPIVFGIIVIINMEMAQITPPIGINLYTVSGISKIPLMTLARGVLPYIVIQLIMVYVVYFFPELVLWLPGRSALPE